MFYFNLITDTQTDTVTFGHGHLLSTSRTASSKKKTFLIYKVPICVKCIGVLSILHLFLASADQSSLLIALYYVYQNAVNCIFALSKLNCALMLKPEDNKNESHCFLLVRLDRYIEKIFYAPLHMIVTFQLSNSDKN